MESVPRDRRARAGALAEALGRLSRELAAHSAERRRAGADEAGLTGADSRYVRRLEWQAEALREHHRHLLLEVRELLDEVASERPPDAGRVQFPQPCQRAAER